MGLRYQPILSDRPTGKRVLKTVKLTNGREIQFEVFVADHPNIDPGPLKVRPMGDSSGWVSRRGPSW